MNTPRLIFPARQVLCCCIALIACAVAAGCNSPGSSSSGTPPGSSTAVAIRTDTASVALGKASGSGGGGVAFSVPVRASGAGNEVTQSFMVSDSTLNVAYAYDCSSTGGSGFTADLISGSAASPGSDDEGIANETGTANQVTGTVNPQDTPGPYYLQVQTPCDWEIVVENG